MFGTKYHVGTAILPCLLVFLSIGSVAQGCGGPQITWFVKHHRDLPGEQLTDVVSYEEYAGLDNSTGSAALQVLLEFDRRYKFQIIERMNTNEVPAQDVQEKIVELYKLPLNNTEEVEQTALCPVSVVIPAGHKGIITVEWTERWAEGMIIEGTEDKPGDWLGTYSVFLGYYEPCSMVKQENVQ